MIRIRCCFLALLCAWCSTATAAELETSVKQSLLRVVQQTRKKHSLPALGAALILHGKLAAIATDGVRVSTRKTPVTDQDLFHLGSCTKAMTATLIAKLVEKGKLRWDTKIHRLLPNLANDIHNNYYSRTNQ